MFRKLLFVFFLSTASTICGQFSNIQGTPLVKNFTEEDTNSDLTVFDISQSANGLMYFATSNGLKEFDGVRWKNYKLGIESDLRSVLYKDDQHIYTSGHGGFGYWHKNDKGLLEYTSLFFKPPTKQAPLLPTFSSIKEIDNKIIFQTGYGPSGLPHIGTFGEVARTTMMINALNHIQKIDTDLITFSDDMDGLRKIPENIPNDKVLRENILNL